jgi:hypothetical protein
MRLMTQFDFITCLLSSQGLPFLSVPHSEDSKCTAPVPSGSTKVCPRGFSREECPTWLSCQDSGSQCHLSQKATCLHGKCVFSYHSSSLHVFLFSRFRNPTSGLSCYRFHHESLSQFISAITDISLSALIELQGHATKNQDLLLASGTISLKGTDGLNAVDDDIMAAVSFVTAIIFPANEYLIIHCPIHHLT